jgi:HSP20 family molecular chaperone IbpA
MQFDRRERLPLRIVSEEEFRQLQREQSQQEDRDSSLRQTIRLPLEREENRDLLDLQRRVKVVRENNEIRIIVDQRQVEQRIVLRREEAAASQELEAILSQRGELLIRARREQSLSQQWNLDAQRSLESEQGNKLMRDGNTESEEYRLVRKYLKQLERANFPNSFRTLIARRENHSGTKIQMWIDLNGYRKDDLKVLVKEQEGRIVVEARQENKNEVCVSQQQLRREFVQWPMKLVDLKQAKAVITRENWLLIEVPTLVDLMPTLRQRVEEQVEVKRA